jgi:hypothetical protein
VREHVHEPPRELGPERLGQPLSCVLGRLGDEAADDLAVREQEGVPSPLW